MTEMTEMTDYQSFQILIDTPAASPGLGFEDYATALSEAVTESPARFAVGIFGDWGSGKTTLMDAVRNRLNKRDDTLTVEFNAWRYERESDLIVPLLDELRSELLHLAAAVPAANKVPMQHAARKIGQAARAVLAGSTFKAKTPVADVQLDPGRMMEEWRRERQPPSTQSFYHIAFNELSNATQDVRTAGLKRIVVFVDDLDRCLPSRALEVLESMKLFFDINGFVFICGLDQGVVSRAVSSKYSDTPGTGDMYVQKIFQLPFGLPRISSSDLESYSQLVMHGSGWTPEQQQDYNSHVRPHLPYLVENDTVNPREVKRLINSYIIQMKILTRRLANVDPRVVMGVQLIGMRSDWHDQYLQLAADPQLYVRRHLESADHPAGAEDDDGPVQLPPSLYNYLSNEGRPLFDVPDLSPYILAAESTRSTDPSIITAQVALLRLRHTLTELAQEHRAGSARGVGDVVSAALRPVESLASRRKQGAQSPLAFRLTRGAERLKRMAGETKEAEFGPKQLERFVPTLDELDHIAQELRSEWSPSRGPQVPPSGAGDREEPEGWS